MNMAWQYAMPANIFLHLTGVPLRCTPSGEKDVMPRVIATRKRHPRGQLMPMTKLETWKVLGNVDSERFGIAMSTSPWDLSNARLFHYPLGPVDLSGDDLSYANLQQSDINGADLTKANMSNAMLQDAWVTGASLVGAKMQGAKLGGCKPYGSDLSTAHLPFADIDGTDLRHASLRGAMLSQAKLIGGRWDDVDFSGAAFGYTILANVNLSNAKNLETVKYHAPSTLGMDTILNSGGNLPDAFLLGCGVPPSVITQIHSIFASQSENKAFLSYTYESQEHDQWVDTLAHALNARGIFVFFDKWDVAPGDSITKFMDTGIGQSKCGLFICTPESVARADSETRWTGYEAIQFKADLVESKKRVIAILRAGTDVPRYLRGRRYIDARDDDNFNDCVTEIVDLVMSRSRRPALGKSAVST
jgi:hypothetical protein